MTRRTAHAWATLSMLLLVGGYASAQPPEHHAITVENAWARRAPMMAPGGAHAGAAPGMPGMGGGNGAIYVTIRNTGAAPDALVSATSDAAQKVELHQTKNEGGVMMMAPIPELEVPAGGTIEMRPGGYHVMLLGLTRDLAPGDTVRVTLNFRRAGAVTVQAPVR